MNKYNNYFLKVFMRVMKIPSKLNKYKSESILTEKMNPHYKSIEVKKKKDAINLIRLKKRMKDNNNKGSIKVNLSHRYAKLNISGVKNEREVKTRNEKSRLSSSNNSLNSNNKEKSISYFYSTIHKLNHININNSINGNTYQNKENNIIRFFRPSNITNQYNIESTKNKIKKNLFANKNHKELNKTEVKYSKRTMTSKFLQAQEQWANNYFATVIQKIFRGYIFRINFLNKMSLKNRDNIYIKKIPKYKAYQTKFIKMTNSEILETQKKYNKNNIFMKKSFNEYSKRNDKYEVRTYINKKPNSKKFNKIKEIVITKKKDCPIVSLNMNNIFLPNYICQYNNCTYNSNYNNEILPTYSNNIIDIKYFERLKLNAIFKKKWKHWVEITIKSKILSSIISLKRKKLKKSQSSKEL